MSRRNSFIFSLILIAILTTVLVYLPALQGDFYHDDQQNLVLNKTVQIEELNLDTFRNAAFSSYSGILRRPISMASFALNYYFFGTNPFSFKVINLFLHICTGILVFLFVSYLIKAININSIYSCKSKSNFWIPACAMILWLLHPIHVSTTAYIVQRMTILSAMFSLLSIVLYLVGRIKITQQEKYGALLILASIICIIPAVLSKENGILIVPLIVITEIFLFKFQPSNIKITKIIKYCFYIGCAGTAYVLFFYFDLIKNHIEIGYLYREFSLHERLLTQPRILLNYMQWLIIPNITALGLFHDDIVISTSILNPLSTLLSILVICCIFIIGFIVRKSNPLIFFGLCWFFIAHSLESSFIALEMVYEHRNYLPSIGIILVVIEIFRIIYKKIDKFYFPTIIMLAVFGLFATTTYIRASQWSNNIDFAYYEALHHPNSSRAVFSLGRIYANLTLTGQKKFKEDAYTYLEKARQLDKGGIIPESSLMIFAHKLKEPFNDQWIPSIVYKLESSRLSPSDLTALSDITKCAENSCLLTNEDAFAVISAAFSSPNAELKSNRRASLLTIYANFLTNRAGDFKAAETVMREAIEISPNIPQYYINYINLLLVLQRIDDATSYLAQLKKIDQLGTKSEHIKDLENELKIVKSILNKSL